MLRSYKRYYVGFFRYGQYFVNIDFCRKLPKGWPTPKQEPLFGGKCSYFFLRYDFQNDILEMICPDAQLIEIDRSPEQIKNEPNIEELLKLGSPSRKINVQTISQFVLSKSLGRETCLKKLQ